MNEEKRESFGTRLGFILVSAGCAIGIGNVWKFPYVAGQNGGGVFVLFYILFLIIMGIPVMTMELAIGRRSSLTMVKGYKKLEKPGQKWHLHGWVCLAGCYILMMYYTTVAGWMMDYFVRFATGRFIKKESVVDVSSAFDSLLSDPFEMGIFTVLTVLLGFGVLSFGVKNGLEKVNKFMMIGLLSLLAVLAINSLRLDGAMEGLKFFLFPNWKRAVDVGIGKMLSSAMNQAFFTLSIGMGSIEVFGSYMDNKKRLTGESITIASLDTIVAIMSGIIIFPACFAYGVEPSQGPSLIFATLPEIFINMPLGRFWGTLFFLLMTFASFSTVTAVFENIVISVVDIFGIKREVSVVVNCLFLAVSSIPCVLGFNILKDITFLGGRNVLDFEDFLVSNLILPTGALVMLLFCVTKFGWGFDNYIEEVNTGEGLKMPASLKYFYRIVLPVLIIIIIINGIKA